MLYSVFVNVLRGSSRLKSFKPAIVSRYAFGRQGLLAFTSALRKNKGLVELNLRYYGVNDGMWDAFCDSLNAHQTLEILDLSSALTATTITLTVIVSRI
jgi:hypothetical protein